MGILFWRGFFAPFPEFKDQHKMSQAFIRESDDQWLDEVAPTVTALIHFLTRENNGIRVYEKNTFIEDGREIHEMSNGLFYGKDFNGRWQVIERK